jgi:hypothetical protein
MAQAERLAELPVTRLKTGQMVLVLTLAAVVETMRVRAELLPETGVSLAQEAALEIRMEALEALESL